MIQDGITFIRYIRVFCATTVLLFFSSIAVFANPTFVIGFSQATTTEPWRLLFNNEVRAEAAKYPAITLLVRNGQDSTHKQIADVEEFIARKVDAILISPKEAQSLTPVINKAYDIGIPIFVLDRDIANDHYSQFIGGDNKEIGRQAGLYAVKKLGGVGKAKGNIIELWGGMKSTPAQDRHDGFWEVVSLEKGITLINKAKDADWKQDLAYEITLNTLTKTPNVDLIYAHNDPMAYGAYLAVTDLKLTKKIIYIGIDAIPSEGVRWVHDGIIDATFLYKTPGQEAIRQAVKALSGKKIEKRITLNTQKIDTHNAKNILQKYDLIE